MEVVKIILTVLALLLLFSVAAATWAWASARRCAREVTTVRYELDTELTESVRIVQLTDLHGHVFGTENDLLIAMVAEEQPDLILMTGDMVDRDAENADVEDHTDAHYQSQTNPKFELYQDKAGQYRFRLKARNGKIIGVSEGYTGKAGCLNGIESVKHNAPLATIEEKE